MVDYKNEEQKDISFVTGTDKFNYRACTIIISNGKLLVMHNERSLYYYLPVVESKL